MSDPKVLTVEDVNRIKAVLPITTMLVRGEPLVPVTEREVAMMCATIEALHAEVTRLKSLNNELQIRNGQVTQMRVEAEAERDAIRARVEAIVTAYDGYRGKGVMPAPDEYQRMVRAINAARLTAPTETPR